MKTTRMPGNGWRRGWILSAFILTSFCLPAVAQSPVITSVRQERTNVTVIAQVPAGIRRATLESRDRLGAASWEPRAVARLDGSGGQVTFRLPLSRRLEVLRVRADATEALPAEFYTGTTSFAGEAGSSGPVYYDYRTLDATPASGGSPSREVVESDIWKKRGSSLYFFNQYRGLQIIDIANPDAARVRGTLDLPAAGEQMYLLGDHHVVLLARDGCAYDQSQVLIVADTNGPPAVVARLPVTGTILESRLVGTALYVASQSWQPVPGSTNSAWEWGTSVSAFDLAAPEAPVKRNQLWYSGYGNVVAATDIYLFVVTQSPVNWWQSIVRLIDITAPDGTMNAYDSVTLAGRVADKFKLNYTAGVFTTVSEDRHATNGTRLVTRLETFRLPDPRSAGPVGIAKLGELELGHGESLRATRFSGDQVYVVTFFQIDPLWVVDLSDPVRPRIAGSVEIPGWSTYIEPLGDRLVTMGVETGRVAVSLFDVTRGAPPALLSRVLLGDTWSWSEANYDEKAFAVLPDDGLILVPYYGDITNQYSSILQLIDLERDTLTARGLIDSAFQFRRAMVHADRVVSISGWEMLSVDATDRDHPVVSGRVELAWSIDRVFLAGDHLLELSTGGGWDGLGGPVVRTTRADDPAVVLDRLSLTNLPLLGACVEGNRLYVAQGTGSGYYYPYPIPLAVGAEDVSGVPPTVFSLTVVGLDRLPALEIIGQTSTATQPLGWGGDWTAVWPRPGLLVWSGGGGSPWIWYRTMDVLAVGGAMAPAGFRPWPIYWDSGGGHLLAFDVREAAAPQFLSEVNLNTNGWWSYSRALTADGLVYLSHRNSEFIVGLDSPWQTTAPAIVITDPTTGRTSTNSGPTGTWVMRSYLDVVDYADPADPLVRRPVQIPGTLQGLSSNGKLLYTVGAHWTADPATAWREYLDASAYDGTAAYLVDSIPLSSGWPHPVHVSGSSVFVGNPGDVSNPTNSIPPALETWALSTDRKFTRLGSVRLAEPANTLAEFPGMLAVQGYGSAVELYDLADPAALRQIGRGEPGGCWWFDLRHADGNRTRGLWVPLGSFGVAFVPVKP